MNFVFCENFTIFARFHDVRDYEIETPTVVFFGKNQLFYDEFAMSELLLTDLEIPR